MVKGRQTVGLIGAGKFADSPLFRNWQLQGRLGPVKAPSLRVATRITNILRAGYPAKSYQDFEQCNLILISVPDHLIEASIAELSWQALTWHQKAVVLCSASRGIEELAALSRRGAQVATLSAAPGFEGRWILIEGEKLVTSQICRLMGARTRVTTIRPCLKPFYLAALACTGSLLIPMLAAASELLRLAGMSKPQAAGTMEGQVQRSMRAFLNSGRKAVRDSSDVAGLSQRISAVDAHLAVYMRETALAASRLIKGDRAKSHSEL